DARSQLDATQSELHTTAARSEDYRQLAAAGDKALAELADTYDRFKADQERAADELRRRVGGLEKDVELANGALAACRGDLEAAVGAEREMRQAREEGAARVAQLESAAEQREAALEALRQDMARHAGVAQSLQEQYEREIVAHAKDIEATLLAREKLRESQRALTAATAELDASRQGVQLIQADAARASERAAADVQAAEERLARVGRQNALLLAHLESIGHHVSDATVDPEHVVEGSGEEGAASLREVIVYLRRERELVAAQLEVAQQEAQRWRQQATHAQRMLDDVRQELTQESVPQAKDGGSAQDSADQAQLLRESNSVLRSELTAARTRLRDVEADLLRVRDQEVPQLRSAHAALTAELGAARAQAEQLAGMCEHWKQRHEKVLAKYQMIEPEEYDALKVENAKMAADCEALRQQIADLQKHAAEAGEQRSAAQSSRVRSLQADVARLRAQIEAQLKELEEVREKSSQAEAAAAAGAREQLEAAQADVQAAQAAAQASKGKYEKLHTVFTKLREQSVDKLEASNRTIKEREAAIQALTAQIEAAQEGGSDVAAATATVAALTEEKDRAVAKQNALAEELQTAHAQLSEAREQLQARSAQVQPAADDASGGEAVRRQLAEAEAKVKEYEGQLEQLKARALRYARDNKAFQARVSELEKQLAGADGGTLQAQLDAAKQQLADAEAKIETATTNAKKSAELRSKLQISRANKRADDLEKQVAALEAKIGELAPGESASLKRPNDAADGPAKKAHVEG
ncbi:Filament-forming protein, partial [Coemansia sp. 'formosensis']